jgi:[ribosomal protein S18]-alanine N-acetyltransferase
MGRAVDPRLPPQQGSYAVGYRPDCRTCASLISVQLRAVTFLELHPLTAQHLDAAVALDQLCFGGLWTRSGYERELESPCSQMLVLEAKCASKASNLPNQSAATLTPNQSINLPITLPPETFLFGLGCFWSILEEAHITILAVHPDYRHQGFGQLLLYALLRDAKRRQLEWATLEVKPSNQAALSLYHKFGFSEAGRRRRYYKDTGEDALILWRSGLQSPEFEETLTNCYQQVEPSLAKLGWQLSEF